MVAAETRETILRFVNAVKERGIRVEKAVIFGSYASGKSRPDSDLDVAIISPDFGKDRFEEGKMLFQIAWRIDSRIEPVAVSSKTYQTDTWIPLIYEIRERGLELEIQ
jgi:predicted nucleotidyltransferase